MRGGYMPRITLRSRLLNRLTSQKKIMTMPVLISTPVPKLAVTMLAMLAGAVSLAARE
jgi:hypothetical protein